MKVYSLYCAYWSAGDWYQWNELNRSMDPTDSEILGVYLTEDEAYKAMQDVKPDSEYHLDLCVYETDDIENELIAHLKQNDYTKEDIKNFTVKDWADVVGGKKYLLERDLDNRFVEHDSPALHGDEIIVSWSYWRYVGYAHKFEGIHTADELGFECEDDLATGDEDRVFRRNYTMILNHEEVSALKEDELEDAILEELNRDHWKWTRDSHYTWHVHRKFSTEEEEA